MTTRYVARRVRARDGRYAGWGVYHRGHGTGIHLAVGYSGALARWRAHWQAASLNHAMSRRAR